MAQYCPNCGEMASDADTFCSECGTSLGAGQGGGTGGNDRYDSGWDDQQQSGWDDQQQSGWDDQQQSGWDGKQGGGRRTGRGGGGVGRGRGIPRKGAIDTFREGLQWLIGIPALAVAFILVDVVSSLGQAVSVLFTVAGWLLSLIVWGVAYRYTEQLVFGQEVRGSSDELFDAVSEVASRLLSLIGIGIVYAIAVGIGLILLIIPGIYIGGRLILAFPACVLDGKGVSDSLSTGWDVGGGNVLKLVGIFLISAVAVVGLQILAGIFGGFSAVNSPVFLLLTAPITGILGGAVQMGVGRVYLENRPRPRASPGRQRGGRQNTGQY